MPPTMRKRGHPKGLEKTVIGLARKRQCFSKLPYVRRPAEEKKWYIYYYNFTLLCYYTIIINIYYLMSNGVTCNHYLKFLLLFGL